MPRKKKPEIKTVAAPEILNQLLIGVFTGLTASVLFFLIINQTPVFFGSVLFFFYFFTSFVGLYLLVSNGVAIKFVMWWSKFFKKFKNPNMAKVIAFWVVFIIFVILLFSSIYSMYTKAQPKLNVQINTESYVLDGFCSEVCLDYGSEIKSKVWSEAQLNYCLCYNETDVVGKEKVVLSSDGSMESFS